MTFKCLLDLKVCPKNMFKNYVTKQVESGALTYLKSMIKSKGQEIKYTHIEMQDYLRTEAKIKISENRIFLEYDQE